MPSTPALWAVIPAAGRGSRLGGKVPKQHLEIAGRTLLEHSLEAVLEHPEIRGAALALAPDDPHWSGLERLCGKVLITVEGGGERHESVLSGLRGLATWAATEDWVLVHDAARPCLHPTDLNRLIDALRHDQVGGILAAPARDTLKRAEHGRIEATIARQFVWHAMTPQMFRYGLLLDCLQAACEDGATVTDEASAVERAGYRPRIVEGSWQNLKVTRVEDLRLAEFLLTERRKEATTP